MIGNCPIPCVTVPSRAGPGATHSHPLPVKTSANSAALSCRDCDRVHLRPDDQVLGVVRAARPSRWLPEASDVEPLARALRERYGLLLDDVWHDGLTLGGLFQRVQQQRGKPAL
jgi:propanediol dehydratase small subunit